LDAPVLTQDAFEFGASNELGAHNAVRFVSNINGFFLFEECRGSWATDGERPSYRILLAAADEATMDAVVNPDDPLFGIEGSMPDRIWRYRRETDQQVPETRGAVVRIIVRSPATKAAIRLEDLTTAAGTFIDRLYLGGSGVRNELFRQHLAAAVDFPVYAGLVDATAVGNILLQAVATGTIFDLTEERRLVTEEMSLTEYQPSAGPPLDTARDRMQTPCDRTVGDRRS